MSTAEGLGKIASDADESGRPALRVGPAPDDYGDAFAEYEAFFRAGIDGLFSDNPDTAAAARDAFNAGALKPAA